jgi:hypothetical protein
MKNSKIKRGLLDCFDFLAILGMGLFIFAVIWYPTSVGNFIFPSGEHLEQSEHQKIVNWCEEVKARVESPVGGKLTEEYNNTVTETFEKYINNEYYEDSIDSMRTVESAYNAYYIWSTYGDEKSEIYNNHSNELKLELSADILSLEQTLSKEPL